MVVGYGIHSLEFHTIKTMWIREHRRDLTEIEWEEIKKLIPPNRKHPIIAYAIEITRLSEEKENASRPSCVVCED